MKLRLLSLAAAALAATAPIRAADTAGTPYRVPMSTGAKKVLVVRLDPGLKRVDKPGKDARATYLASADIQIGIYEGLRPTMLSDEVPAREVSESDGTVAGKLTSWRRWKDDEGFLSECVVPGLLTDGAEAKGPQPVLHIYIWAKTRERAAAAEERFTAMQVEPGKK